MGKKLHQVTDNIHGTIYLSELESELISTPYFYRLHDVYQSSTVYMTYPSNRTKRYEHSLGTMELASTMFYTAVSNADSSTRTKLFEYLDEYFTEILDMIINKFEEQTAPYFTKNKDQFEVLFSEEAIGMSETTINDDIQNAVASGCFTDSALDYFQFYPMQNNAASNNHDVRNFFLYRCLLQAVRIIALFHDVGHPPYSHIIEDVLDSLYKETAIKINNGNNTHKYMVLYKCLNNYYEDLKTQTLFSDLSLPKSNPELHERIGLSFLQSAINDTIPNVISEVLNTNNTKSCKVSSILYYILVTEFAISMLVERNIFFKSFHKLVDGVVDADRLDYITRDSLNSGIDWGRILYKRLINSSKLVYLTDFDGTPIDEKERPFVIAYPYKVANDIEDLLLTRYKIFARINYHHRCMKTSSALKLSVMILANDYLSSQDDNKCINSDINLLWLSLGLNAGDRKKRVILWNDSWLISTLHRALINLNGQQSGEKIKLKDNLEEILLNKKRFYSILKRRTDNQEFLKKIFTYAEITEEKIQLLLDKEKNKYITDRDGSITKDNILQLAKANAYDTINRIEKIIQDGDIETLDQLIPTAEKNIADIICEALEISKTKGDIVDYGIIVNVGRKKTGLPTHKDRLDEIYLYNGKKCFTFNEYNSLKPQIETIYKSIPWLYIYIAPATKSTNFNNLAEKVLNETANHVAQYVKKRFEELFP